MHINWLGQTCVKLQTKNTKDEDVAILIDPYKPENGEFPRSFSPQAALFSNGQKNSTTLSQNPFIMDTLGEVELKDTMIYAIPGSTGSETVIFKLLIDGITIVHIGSKIKTLSSATKAKLDGADILLIPVGGDANETFNPKDAAELAIALEPRIIIPIAYKCDTDPKAEPIEAFIKQIGIEPEIINKKLIIKKKDLPQENTLLMILEKHY